MGMDLDLNVAMRHATRETVDFLQAQFALSPADAYALASIAVDFRVAEAVDSVQMIHGMIPKKLFKKNPEFWARHQ
jgi:acetamidase/formamidase